ncbi:MAG: hypothetical protein AABM33_05960 [Pseudomonadota bacterium]
MSRGGAKPGERRGGRKKGSKNKRTRELEAAKKEAAKKIETAIGKGAFKGDAHDYLMTVYKNPKKKEAVRIDAAGKAIKFEKPALAAVDTTIKGKTTVTVKAMTFPDAS